MAAVAGRSNSQDKQPHHWHCARDIRLRMLVRGGHHTDPPVAVLRGIAAEIRSCCGHRPLKAHRLAWGLTVRRAVAAVHALDGRRCALTERRWLSWEAGGNVGAGYQDLLGRLFHADPVRLGFAVDHSHDPEDAATPCALVTGSSSSRNNPALAQQPRGANGTTVVDPVAADPSGGPLTVERVVLMAAQESADYADHPSNVGPATIGQLRVDATRLARMFANAPRLEVFGRARWLRDRAFGLLDGRQRRTEFRDLYFLAGVTCGMLAEITQNLGFNDAAMAHARTAWLCAEQADHNGLRAWILGEQSVIAYHDGRPGDAVHFARRGQQYATAGSVTVSLAAAEARAAARLGDTETTRAALIRAGEARERVAPDDLDEFGGIMGFSAPHQHHFSAESFLGIGDGAAVIAEAEACISGYLAGPESEHAYDNEASAQVNLSTAHVLGGDLEAARAAAQPAFGIAPELRTQSLNQRFRRLHRHLTAPAVATAPVGVDLRNQIEDFLANPTRALPGA